MFYFDGFAPCEACLIDWPRGLCDCARDVWWRWRRFSVFVGGFRWEPRGEQMRFPLRSPGLGTSLPVIFAARALDGFFCGNMGAPRPLVVSAITGHLE